MTIVITYNIVFFVKKNPSMSYEQCYQELDSHFQVLDNSYLIYQDNETCILEGIESTWII